MIDMKQMAKSVLALRPSFETSVGVVLFVLREEQPQFLLLRYPHGHWDFVKGHRESGETDEETLRRELQEETGITDARILSGFSARVKFRYTAKGTEREKRQRKGSGLFVWKTVYYLAAQTSQTSVSLSDEHLDWAWLGYEDARRMITHNNSRKVLDEAMRSIGEAKV
jgi:8-oxo-dGTP pyrophosphatase MutT (NUDIX family)